MKICLPTQTNLGLQSRIAPNFGTSPWLLVVESDSLEILAIDRTDVSQRDMPINMDLIACQGMSEQLFNTLHEQGVPIVSTLAQTVSAALADYEEGNLRTLGTCCQGRHADCDGDHLEGTPEQ